MPEPVPAGIAAKTVTGVPLERLTAINASLQKDPEGFTFARKLERGRERRKVALANPDERSIDWAIAEELALATILADGVPVRLTGEDVQRGTFSHRQAVLYDYNTGKPYTPIYVEVSAASAAAATDGFARDYDGVYRLQAVESADDVVPASCSAPAGR